jgi:hypothetical protein
MRRAGDGRSGIHPIATSSLIHRARGGQGPAPEIRRVARDQGSGPGCEWGRYVPRTWMALPVSSSQHAKHARPSPSAGPSSHDDGDDEHIAAAHCHWPVALIQVALHDAVRRAPASRANPLNSRPPTSPPVGTYQCPQICHATTHNPRQTPGHGRAPEYARYAHSHTHTLTRSPGGHKYLY